MATDSLNTLDQLVDRFGAHGADTAIVAFRRDGREELSYAELAARIRAAAAGFQARGVGLGDFVMIWAPNSPQWIVCYFGIVTTGAAAIPLDHQATAESARGVLEHARPKVILTTAAQREALEQAGGLTDVECYLLDAPESDAASWQRLLTAGQPARAAVEPSQIASLLYTSGTTGTPKAVPLTHANLTANLRALLTAKLIAAGDRVLMPLPLHHTYPFTIGTLTVLGSGGTIVMPAGVSGPEIAQAAKETRATALLAIPRLCAALWDSIETALKQRPKWQAALFRGLLRVSIAIRRLTGLRKLLFPSVHARLGRDLDLIGSGGAKLGADLEWKLEGLGWRVLTGYGLTETSPVLTFNCAGAARLGSEGKPLGEAEVRIAPVDGQPHGEIHARGPNVFAGYWENAEATAAAFTPDGWFRTGDLGFFDDDGFLHIAGRNKEVIVLSDGKNVFPEDVEKAYLRSPLFRELAVLEQRGKLVALIVPNDEEVRRRGALRAAALLREELEDVAASLPPYQRVTAYRTTRRPLPRTQLGKLKRHLLGELYQQSSAAEATETAAPLSDEDRQLVSAGVTGDVWRWLGERFPDRPLHLEMSPQLDLQIDSLEWVSMTLELERRFKVALGGDAVSRIVSLRDLLHEVSRAEPPAAAEPETAAAAPEPPGALHAAAGAVLLLFAKLLLRTLFRLRVSGARALAGDGPYVITPNHTSYLDPIAVAAALPWRQLRRTYWAGWVGVMYTGPLMRFVSRATRVLPVDPDRDLAGAIRLARAVVDAGYNLVWFPEGRRSPVGRLEAFQGGIGVLLEGSRAAAVPTAIRGAFEAWPRQRRWPRPAKVEVTFGTPRPVTELGPAQGPEAAERIRAELEREVAALLGETAPR